MNHSKCFLEKEKHILYPHKYERNIFLRWCCIWCKKQLIPLLKIFFLGDGFKDFLEFSSLFGGNDPFWRAYISDGLAQPPTSFDMINDSSLSTKREVESLEIGSNTWTAGFMGSFSLENERMCPENQWLGDVFPVENSPFLGEVWRENANTWIFSLKLTAKAAENGWLEFYVPLKRPIFPVLFAVSFRGCNSQRPSSHWGCTGC